jgi:PIN domain nuclease of toxin-antitoxin system
MNYLIDTHTLLWLAFHEEKLSRKVKNILLDDLNEIYISVVSIWEINLKYSMGKLSLKGRTPEELFQSIDANFAPSYLQLTTLDTISFYKLQSYHHKDPFDRMIIWQAIHNNFVFITDDENIHKYTDIGLKVLW